MLNHLTFALLQPSYNKIILFYKTVNVNLVLKIFKTLFHHPKNSHDVMEDIPEEISELVPKTLEVSADSKSLEFSRTFYGCRRIS